MTDAERKQIADMAEENAILAMNTIVRWKKMTDMCEDRNEIGCKGCPYEKDMPCAKPSTTAILRDAAILFERYLVISGKEIMP